MEAFYLSLLCVFVSVIYISLHFLFYKKQSVPSLPPGKTGWPFIGETLEFVSTGRKGFPEKFVLDRMAKYSRDVFRTHLLGDKFAVFCGDAGNKFLFSNENKLVRVWWPYSIHKVVHGSDKTSGNAEAANLRKFLPSFIKPEALQAYVGIMDDIARRHFAQKWENKEQVVVLPLAKDYTFQLSCKLFFSIEDPSRIAEFAECFNVLVSGFIAVPINIPGTRFNKAIKAGNIIRKDILSIIRERKADLARGKASPTQDILSHMLSTTVDENGNGGLETDEQNIVGKITGLLIAGHDNASITCTFVVKYLAEYPEIYDAVRKEQMQIAASKAPGEFLNWEDVQKMKYSWNVACEALRLAPPGPGAFREAIVDFTYKGFSIPKGWKLFWNVNSTHKNPEFFPDPENFDPSRFEGSGPAPYTFVPFGGGPRMCPGKEYARLEILVFIHNLVKRFKWEKIIPDEPVIVDPIRAPVKGLPVRLFPYNKA